MAFLRSFFRHGTELSCLSLLPVLSLLTLFGACSSKKATFAEETVDGLRLVHNIEPLWGTTPKVGLEFIRKIGGPDEDDERSMFYYPADAAVDGEGYLLILDAGNHKVKRFDREGRFVSAFGTKGGGPGEFVGPTRLDVCPDGDILVGDLAANVVNIFGPDGRFRRRIHNGGLSPIQVLALRSGDIAVFYVRRFSKDPSRQTPLMVSVFAKDGKALRAFVSPRIYEDPPTNFWCNSAGIAGDDADNIYVNFEAQNRIEKYSAGGELLFRVDRLLGYLETPAIEKKVFVYDEGPLVAVSFNRFSAGIQVDRRGRLWSGTLLRQKDSADRSGEGARREGGRPEDYTFEIYDPNGVLLGRLQEGAYHGQRFRIAGDRLFLVDKDVEMAVSEYRIVDK